MLKIEDFNQRVKMNLQPAMRIIEPDSFKNRTPGTSFKKQRSISKRESFKT